MHCIKVAMHAARYYSYNIANDSGMSWQCMLIVQSILGSCTGSYSHTGIAAVLSTGYTSSYCCVCVGDNTVVSSSHYRNPGMQYSSNVHMRICCAKKNKTNYLARPSLASKELSTACQ